MSPPTKSPEELELERALKPPRNEAEARRMAYAVRKLAGESGPATMKPVAVYEPEWTIEVAARLVGQGGDDWRWVQAADLIASFQPELLLQLLTALRPLAIDKQRVTLDRVGESLAIAGHERPTLAECRAAIELADDAPRRRSTFTRLEAPADADRVLRALVLEALGGDASESTVRVDRTEHYSPGDVNEPERTHVAVTVSGERRRGTPLTVTLDTTIGARDIGILVDGAADARDGALAKVWAAVGVPRTAWDD